MTTIKNEHLLSVYVPEVGTPHSLNIIFPTTLTPEVLQTGSLSCNTTSTGNFDDAGVETPISGPIGVGLSVDIRIIDGEVTDIERVSAKGAGYSPNEIVEVDFQVDNGGNKAKVVVAEVDEFGGVVDLTIINSGDTYSIESGFVDTLQLKNNAGDSLDLRIEISSSDFLSIEVVSTVNISPTEFATVGDNLEVVDSLGNVCCEVVVATVNKTFSGGIHKYSGEKLIDDVKEIISEEAPPIVTENVDYDPSGGFDVQGDITYDKTDGKLTFHRTAPFDRILTDDFYIHNDGDTAEGTYNFTDPTADAGAPTEIINIENKDGETLKINSSGVVTQPNVNVPSDDGDLVNKKFIDEFKSDTDEKFQNIENSTDVIRELLEFDAFGNKYSINLVNSAPASLRDGKIYLLTSETPTERTEGDYVQRYVDFSGVTEVYISENNEDGNQVFSDFTIFKNNSELTLNQLKIEYAGGFGRYLIKSDAELLSGGAKFNVEPFRVSDKLISEVDEPPIDGVFREGEVSLLLRVSAVVTYDNDAFVLKSGDQMTGKLTLKHRSSTSDVLLIRDKDNNSLLRLGLEANDLSKVVVENDKQFKIGTRAKQIFKIYKDSTCILTSLREPSNDEDAATKKYVDEQIDGVPDVLDDRYVKLDGTSVVSDYFRLRGPNATGDGQSTFQVIEDGEHKLYNLSTPEDTNAKWAANVEYVQNYVSGAIDNIDLPDPDVDLSNYLPLTGGLMTGELRFDRNNNQYTLLFTRDGSSKLDLYHTPSGSHSLTVRRGEEFKIVTQPNNNSSSQQVFKTYKDGTCRIEYLRAPDFSHHAANKSYVDQKAGTITTGTSTSPSLSTGQLYYNTSTKQLFIGE